MNPDKKFSLHSDENSRLSYSQSTKSKKFLFCIFPIFALIIIVVFFGAIMIFELPELLRKNEDADTFTNTTIIDDDSL